MESPVLSLDAVSVSLGYDAVAAGASEVVAACLVLVVDPDAVLVVDSVLGDEDTSTVSLSG